MDATTALEVIVPPTPSSQDRGQTMTVGLAALRRQRAGTSGSASPSASRSARRSIAASQLRRIAPLAGRIRRQERAKRRAELGSVQATRVLVLSWTALPVMGSSRKLAATGHYSGRRALSNTWGEGDDPGEGHP